MHDNDFYATLTMDLLLTTCLIHKGNEPYLLLLLSRSITTF